MSLSLSRNIGPLLQQHCEETQLYLQYDITISQLATLIGINRSYLSKHFASQGITYNAYINGLRIQHFVNLYRQSAANHLPVSAQQLAYQSGFRSYNTFGATFKKTMGMNTTEWMRLTK
jgi:AraC-like DNA-binding protein